MQESRQMYHYEDQDKIREFRAETLVTKTAMGTNTAEPIKNSYRVELTELHRFERLPTALCWKWNHGDS